jgi:ammonium transporter Rh
VFIASEIVVIIIYGLCTKYGEGMLPSEIDTENLDLMILQTDKDYIQSLYPMF